MQPNAAGEPSPYRSTVSPMRDIESVREKILEFIADSHAKVAPIVLERKLSRESAIDRNILRSAIRSLVAERELVYSYHYGHTFLEKSFDKPVRIAKRVVLKPPHLDFRNDPNDIVVKIQAGASFGTGQHPTTRLALRGIEYACFSGGLLESQTDLDALDVGTGSGILAICAALFGIKRAIGTDIDACARSEARENVRLNGLDDRIEIRDVPVENFENPFSMIIANLRFPTLKRLQPELARLTAPAGFVIMSGLKTDEASPASEIYTQNHFKSVWNRNEKDWAGIVLKRVA